MVIGAALHDNEIVQFHLRDAQTSAHDLEQLLARYAAERARGGAGRWIAVLVSGARQASLRPRRSRHRRRAPSPGRRPARRLLLQRRNRPGARHDVSARLHQRLRAVQESRRVTRMDAPVLSHDEARALLRPLRRQAGRAGLLRGPRRRRPAGVRRLRARARRLRVRLRHRTLCPAPAAPTSCRRRPRTSAATRARR